MTVPLSHQVLFGLLALAVTTYASDSTFVNSNVYKFKHARPIDMFQDTSPAAHSLYDLIRVITGIDHIETESQLKKQIISVLKDWQKSDKKMAEPNDDSSDYISSASEWRSLFQSAVEQDRIRIDSLMRQRMKNLYPSSWNYLITNSTQVESVLLDAWKSDNGMFVINEFHLDLYASLSSDESDDSSDKVDQITQESIFQYLFPSLKATNSKKLFEDSTPITSSIHKYVDIESPDSKPLIQFALDSLRNARIGQAYASADQTGSFNKPDVQISSSSSNNNNNNNNNEELTSDYHDSYYDAPADNDDCIIITIDHEESTTTMMYPSEYLIALFEGEKASSGSVSDSFILVRYIPFQSTTGASLNHKSKQNRYHLVGICHRHNFYQTYHLVVSQQLPSSSSAAGVNVPSYSMISLSTPHSPSTIPVLKSRASRDAQMTPEKRAQVNTTFDGFVNIVSYNIWNYNADPLQRIQMIANEIRNAGGDIIGFQEIRDRFHDDQPNQLYLLAQALGKDYPNFVYQPAQLWEDSEEGVGILSRYPIEFHEATMLTIVPYSGDSNHRTVLRARISLPYLEGQKEAHPEQRNVIDFYATHWTYARGSGQMSNANETLNFMNKNRMIVEHHDGEDVVVVGQVMVGDLNMYVGDENPTNFLTGKNSVHGQHGDLIDSWEAVHGAKAHQGETNWEETLGYTFSNLEDSDLHNRADRILYRNSQTLEEANEAIVQIVPRNMVRIGWREQNGNVPPSDHLGIVSNFQVVSVKDS